MGKFKDRHGISRTKKILQGIGKVADPILDVLGNAPIPGAGALKAVERMIVTSDEIEEEQKKQILSAIELDLEDLQNARKANSDIQQAEFASWMAKNVPYMIDIFVTIIWGSLTFYLVAKSLNLIKSDVGVDLTGIYGIYAGVTGLMTQVLSFHRGSSSDSRKKDFINNV